MLVKKVKKLGMKLWRILPVGIFCLVLMVSCVYPIPPGSNLAPSSTITNTPVDIPISTATQNEPIPTEPAPSQLAPSDVPQQTLAVASPTPEEVDTARPHYWLDATLDYFAHTLAVSETINYPNASTEAIPDISLVVEANRWPGSFTLVSLSWADGSTIDGYELQEARLQIPLMQPLQPGEMMGLKLTYHLELPEIPPPSDVTRPVPYGYSSRQTNIVDWYPYIPPYTPGKGWVIHPKWGFGEHQVFDMADFDVRLSLLEAVPDLTIASPTPADMDGASYIYHLGAARSFALSTSINYAVQSTNVGDVTVYSYFFPYDRAAGEQVLHDAAAALELYSRLFMPYPHASLSVVEADFLDGMEYDGLFFLSRGFYNLYDGTPQGYLTFIAAHETAHQWWYGIVGNDQALEPWLDESLCTYMEHIFYENVYADYETTTGESIVDWWWYYRVNFYDPSGWVNGSIYDFNLFRPYRDAVYLNGAKFLQDLRTLVGDETFFAFLKDYASREAGHIATSAEFFEILKDHTSINLDELLATYFKVGG